MSRREHRSSPDALSAAARDALERAWEWVEQEWINTRRDPVSDAELRCRISACMNSRTKSYRYVLPTQLSAKAADHSLDARCLQASRPGLGSFDARSVCDGAVVPFDREHENVLGGSPEPYVNNPLRCPEVSQQYRSQQRDKIGWDDLCLVLSEVQSRNDPAFTLAVLRQVAVEIYKRLEATRVEYPVPPRASLSRTLQGLRAFLAESSGGTRPQAVATALLKACGQRFAAWCKVESQSPTTADAQSGRVADIECIDDQGRVVMAVEVKDRLMTLHDARRKMRHVRGRDVREFFFILQKGTEEPDQLTAEIEQHFASGYNVYVFELEEFAKALLALIGEQGRCVFLRDVGDTLESWRAPVEDRRAWAEVLTGL
ncbi:MAG: restriction endonuclease, SacI family [Armatimonadetes bacterium]|nr:restriction endonuclease, SacI family [Armatimonadota bacterium]